MYFAHIADMKIMTTKHEVFSNHTDCHPETCCCLDWMLVDPNMKVLMRSDSKKFLQNKADELNQLEWDDSHDDDCSCYFCNPVI